MVAAGRGWLAIVAMPEQSDSAAGAFQAMSSTADRDTRDTAPPRPAAAFHRHPASRTRVEIIKECFHTSSKQGPVSCSCPCLPPATALMGDPAFVGKLIHPR